MRLPYRRRRFLPVFPSVFGHWPAPVVGPLIIAPTPVIGPLGRRPPVDSTLMVVGRRAFSIAGPTDRNSLPDELIDPARSFDSFTQFLKTILFSLY